MKLLIGSIFFCCLAGSFSSPSFPHHWRVAHRAATPEPVNSTTAKPAAATPKPVIPKTAKPTGTQRNPYNEQLKSYWTFSDDHLYDLECVRGEVIYAIEAQRNCRSYIKCESGNLPARIQCPPRQVFSKDTLNCEVDGLCVGMTLAEREALGKHISHLLRKKDSISNKNQQEFPGDILASHNKSPEEMVIDVFENSLESILCVINIENDFRNC